MVDEQWRRNRSAGGAASVDVPEGLQPLFDLGRLGLGELLAHLCGRSLLRWGNEVHGWSVGAARHRDHPPDGPTERPNDLGYDPGAR